MKIIVLSFLHICGCKFLQSDVHMSQMSSDSTACPWLLLDQTHLAAGLSFSIWKFLLKKQAVCITLSPSGENRFQNRGKNVLGKCSMPPHVLFFMHITVHFRLMFKYVGLIQDYSEIIHFLFTLFQRLLVNFL